MGFGKFLLGGLCAVGAIVAAPIVLPAAAAIGTAAAATAVTVGTAAAATVGTAAAATAATVGTAAAATAATVGSAGAAIAATSAGAAVGGAMATVGGAVGTAAAATAATVGSAGAAIAATSAGAAVGGAMATVGGAVGTAAGIAGLTSVATVTGTTAGATAIGVITTSGAVGAASAASGASKMSKASDLSDEAKYISNRAKEKYDTVENDTNKCLESLGILKLEIWESFERYQNAFKKIRNLKDWEDLKIDETFELDSNELNDIKLMAISAKDLLKGGVMSMGAGQLAGVATSVGITSAATASTGTAISSLSGAAASNASLAALGGGSLSTGGLGMAGGMIVSNALIAAPALAVGGLFINSKGNKSLNAAKDAYRESEIYVDNLETASIELEKLGDLSLKLIDELNKYRSIYDKWTDWLEELVEHEVDSNMYSRDEIKRVFISGQITSILKNLTLTQLITDDQDGEKKVCEESVSKAIKNANNEIESLEVKHNITI